MQMLKKMFKSDGKYYLELDEAQEKAIDAATKANDAAIAKTAKEAPEKAQTVTDTAPVKSENTSVAKAATGGEKSKTAQKASPAETNGKTAPVATNSGASSFEPPFWVAAMYSNNSGNSNGSKSNGNSTGQTFATDNLMPTITKSRRRPGPSLNQFVEMAKQARTRKR